MNYLHSIGIMHSDLKAANVLLKSAAVTQDDPRGFICKARPPARSAPCMRPSLSAVCCARLAMATGAVQHSFGRPCCRLSRPV